jgi:hypothetical protein
MTPACLVKETQRRFAVPFGCQQNVYRSASLIDRSIQISTSP